MQISENLIKIMSKSPEVTDYVLNYLLENKHKLIDILFSSDESANKAFIDVIIKAIIHNFKANSEEIRKEMASKDVKNKAVVLLDYFISLFPGEVGKNWVKMCPFLELFESLTREDGLQLEYLISREIIFVLIDFFLIKDSPYYKSSENRNEMGGKSSNVKFAPLIQTLANVVTRCQTNTNNEGKVNK
jgi:hypothetical protein